jgi:hypothetical protein
MPVMAQEHKQFRAPDLGRDLFLCSRKLDWWLPK